MDEILSHLTTTVSGEIICEIEGVKYLVTPLANIQACLKSARPRHVDTLLDAYGYIYGTSS